MPLQGLPLFSGVAFAATQENGDPCPPECVTDSMEIITWFPAPYGLYGELNSMKLAIGDIDGNGDVSEGDIPPADGQIYVDRGVIFKPIAPENVDNDNINNMIHPAYDFTQKARQGEMVYTTDDKFYHYNGQTWVPQSGESAGANVIYTSCTWAYDYREGIMSVASNNVNQANTGNNPALGRIVQSWSCAPKTCTDIGLTTTDGWTDLGVIINELLSVACSGSDNCSWDYPVSNYHPVSAGRSVRACLRQ